MISTYVLCTVKHGGGGVMVWGCLPSDTVSDLLRIHGTLNQHGYHSILQRYAIPFGLRLVGLSIVFQQDNDPKHTSWLCKVYLTKKESDGVLQMAWPPQSPNLNPIEILGWIGPQSEGKAANKSSAYVGTSSRLLEKHSRWSWLRECQECAKAIKANVSNFEQYKIYFHLFNTCLVTTWLHMCYFIVLMSSNNYSTM